MIKLTFDDYDKLQVHKDGNAFFVCAPDFVDLQTSPVVWYDEDSLYGEILSEWYGVSSNPLIHFPSHAIAHIVEKLNKEREK